MTLDYIGHCAAQFSPGGVAETNWPILPLLPGSRVNVPAPTAPIYSAAKSSHDPRTLAAILQTPTIEILTHAHKEWFTLANIIKLLGGATGGAYTTHRPGGTIADCGKIQVFDGSKYWEWTKWKLSSLTITSYGNGPLDIQMVLAAFGAGGETGAPSAIGTTPALDAIPYSSEGAQIGAGVIDGVLQFSLAFANLLEPVVTHDAAAAAALTGAVLPSGMKNGPVQYSVAIDQLDDATALNPGFASVSALAVALSSAVAAVQTLNFGLQVTKPAVSKVFNIAQGISATRRVYGNLQNGSTPSLALS